ncbi:MAG: glycine--tRNA ligase subunit beta [Holosporales bacterium]|jgi:glycyl-tRNA synthetase beta chain|nr:glycine--tRNA ligase subunit beta [Holosporales bacterium]
MDSDNNIKKNLFFEVFSEEIPAKMQKNASKIACDTVAQILAKSGVKYGKIQASCASRRIWINIDEMFCEESLNFEEKRGPKIDAQVSAIEGFLKSNNLKKDDLLEKNGYFFAKIEKKGEKIEKIPQIILMNFLKLMPWPKSMHWHNRKTAAHSLPWIRPIHSVLCLFEGKPIVFDLEGFGIKTGNTTHGHRFLSNQEFTITSFSQYKKILRENSVIIDYSERQQLIKEEIEKVSKEKGIILKEDQELMDEVTGLVDMPFVIIGDISPEFMVLPEFVLATSMRVHQKYFSTTYSNGKIAPFFIALANQNDPKGIIKAGFEKVLKARLNDALFFYSEDLKKTIDENVDKLNNVIFHKQLGSVKQKIERLIEITPQAQRAAELCKFDLVTAIVGEFEELQGIAGEHYAQKQGEQPEIATAIREHYKPIGQNDSLPSCQQGLELAVSDKVDTLVGFLGIGKKPSGSADPFALRRAALGIIRITEDNENINLEDRVYLAINVYKRQGIKLCEDVFNIFVNFLYERIYFYLKEQISIRGDIIKSVLSNRLPLNPLKPISPNPHEDSSTEATNKFAEEIELRKKSNINTLNISDIITRAKSIQTLWDKGEHVNFMTFFTRIIGFLGKVDCEKYVSDKPSINPEFFETSEELNVYNAIKKSSDIIYKYLDFKEYRKAMNEISMLYNVFNEFFNAVQINTKDDKVRKNRYTILNNCFNFYSSIADFTQIQG